MVRKWTRPLYESPVICEYLNKLYSDEAEHGKPLLPRGNTPLEAYKRARCRIWMDHVGGKIVPGFFSLFQHTPGKEYSLDDARVNFLGHIKTFVKEMDDDGPWFLGERFSLVDVMLAPWAKRLFLIDHYKDGGVGIPAEGEGGEDETVWKRWRV
jgi:glutathione S-transferase